MLDVSEWTICLKFRCILGYCREFLAYFHFWRYYPCHHFRNRETSRRPRGIRPHDRQDFTNHDGASAEVCRPAMPFPFLTYPACPALPCLPWPGLAWPILQFTTIWWPIIWIHFDRIVDLEIDTYLIAIFLYAKPVLSSLILTPFHPRH